MRAFLIVVVLSVSAALTGCTAQDTEETAAPIENGNAEDATDTSKYALDDVEPVPADHEQEERLGYLN